MQIALLLLLAAEAPLLLDDVLRDVAANAPVRTVRASDVDVAQAESLRRAEWDARGAEEGLHAPGGLA